MNHVLKTCDPVSYENSQGQPKWEQAMQAVINSLLNNHTWDLVLRPQGIYKTKFTSECVVEHHKARLATKGFSQQEGIE
jgi:hypothetical protein